jgi:FkbM family methyltransferase
MRGDIMQDSIIYDIETHPWKEIVSDQVRNQIMEPEELTFFRDILNENDVVLDCGANIGLHSINFADCVGPNGKVYSFEPIQANYFMLCRNIMKYNFNWIVPVQAALGKESCARIFYLNRGNMGDCRPSDFWLKGNETVIVPQLKLDDYFSLIPENWNNLSVIKIDTQGCEFDLLSGAQEMFKVHNDLTILMEYWPYGLSRNNQNFEWFCSFLNTNKFNVYDMQRNYQSLKSISEYYFDNIDKDIGYNIILKKD